MSITSINSSDLLSSILAAAYTPVSNTQDSGSNFKTSGTENVQISSIGTLMSAVSQMSGEDKSSIKSFMDEIKEATETGSFDASGMAEEAPEALQEYAEENGIDLTELVQDLSDASQNSGVYGPPPPPPPMMSDTSSTSDTTSTSTLDLSSIEELSNDEKSELQSFMETLKSSVEDGTFDADTLAASAPDALTTLAEENGMDVTDLVQELADDVKNAPPPPPMMMGMAGDGSDFSGLFSTTNSTDETSTV